MEKSLRKEKVLAEIRQAKKPVSATVLAEKFGVSRQVVVGDVALLRANGLDIIATARGYIIPEKRDEHQYLGKIACCHTPAETKSELYEIVDLQAVVVDVVVEHDVYGEITGQLNLRNRDDVDGFIGRVETSEVKLLSELTKGIHLHTIACRDKAHFDLVCEKLSYCGYLLKD